MDSRLKKPLNAGGRESRSSQDLSRAAPEEEFISKQERRKMWSDEWTQSALPKVPEIPGWHLCWLSTTNGYDSIDKRMRLGYVPVRADELPGFDNYRVKAGEDVGFIACNEAPNEEADKVQIQVEQLQGNRDSSGKSLSKVEGEGFGNLNRNVQTPVFYG